ncbi:copper amine oxidase N-terminal domain-containing protein [Paenibacillus bouchesdurhonensis]|uniref:copper amine oxidase N-terminal domain-containing protein n=1 Tax=Paenibacillus bouchesdurhonensis TaxID=1870990 RepID=UPI000DA60C51|nr:copper amine oxidase N-terminal domain-containing protein [Paenibacillus bouchesdurhonensis]
MNKWMTVLIAGIIAFSSFQIVGNVGAADKSNVAVLVDGRKVKFQGGDPVMENNRVQVPLRGVGEALDAEVDFRGKTVTYVKGSKSIVLTLGSKAALVDGQNVMMDTAAKAVKGRTYVPLRFVSENLGETVEWDKVGGWVWIGARNIPSTDDEQFKLIPLSEFKEYTQTIDIFKNTKNEIFSYIKIVKFSDLPIQLGDQQIIYSIDLVQSRGKDYIQIRSSVRNTPISFLVKNSFARGRHGLNRAFVNNGDKTGMSLYPVVSNSDKFQNGKYIENYEGWMNFKIKQADYILIRNGDVNYALAIENPFK